MKQFSIEKKNLKWKGPGKVIGHDGVAIYIRHGGLTIKAHCSRVQLANDLEHNTIKEQTEKHDNNSLTEYTNKNLDNINTVEGTYKIKVNDNQNLIYESDSDNETCEENSKINENDNSTNNPSQQEHEEDVLIDLTNKLAAININENNTSTRSKIEVGQTIDFTIDNISCKDEIIGRAAKATCKYKNAFNIEYKEPVSMYNQQGYVDFDKVNDIVINENKTEQIMLIDEHCFQKAKLYELNSWKTNNIYEGIPY